MRVLLRIGKVSAGGWASGREAGLAVERGGAQPEKTRLWGLAPWGWCAMVGAGVMACVVWFDSAGVVGGAIFDVLFVVLGEACWLAFVNWMSSLWTHHDSGSILFLLIGIAALHVSSVRGWRWRVVVFGMWFAFGKVTILQPLWWEFGALLRDQWVWVQTSGLFLLNTSLALAVGVLVIPSRLVRTAWAVWWLCGVARVVASYSNLPGVLLMFLSIEVWLRAATMASMLIWAVRLRRSIVAVGSCRQCRYDLSGTAVDVPCPECGVVGTRAV